MCALNDVITTHWVMTQGNATLPIYGPPGTAQFVERQMAALEADDYHSGVIEAAQTAARTRAKRLVLTHLVPPPAPEQYPEWIARAADHFDGEIVIGDDLTTITI